MYISNQNFAYLWNGMWNAIIAMTTVGYGDFFPMTYFGRTAVVIGVLFGQFLICLMINGMNNLSQMDICEIKVVFPNES